MTETIKALRSIQCGNTGTVQAADIASRRTVNRSRIFGLLCAGLTFGLASHAEAEPTGSPTADKIFFNCTFTTESLNAALAIDQANLDLLASGQIEASYIIIYVRQNKSDGQLLTPPAPLPEPPPPPKFTGPVLCTNSGLDNFTDITSITEGTAITGPVDIVGAEEASHLQFRPTGGTEGDTEKRVCHTVASTTECFLIQP